MFSSCSSGMVLVCLMLSNERRMLSSGFSAMPEQNAGATFG